MLVLFSVTRRSSNKVDFDDFEERFKHTIDEVIDVVNLVTYFGLSENS